MAALCMLNKIRCDPMNPLYNALPLPYMPERVTLGAFVALRYTDVTPRCRTSQYYWTLIPVSVSHWNHLADPIFYIVGLVGFKSRANDF